MINKMIRYSVNEVSAKITTYNIFFKNRSFDGMILEIDPRVIVDSVLVLLVCALFPRILTRSVRFPTISR